ncbi:MAG: ATP-binding cassette domain-containing protein [Candidatus Bathyarchaeia archaeon]
MLEVQDVSFSFGDHKVVDCVSFSVGKGECFGLLGPNGAGKTTLTKIIVGLLQPKEGCVFINGTDVHRQPKKIKPLVGVCFQESIFYETLTGKENLEFVAALYNVPRGKVRVTISSSLKRVLLTEKDANKRVKHYSGGMKRKLAVAVALLNDPPLLILDEPTTGLDPQARRALWETIEGLKEEGRSILLTTHYMDEADFLSGKVAIIDYGKIIAMDTPTVLKDSVGESVIELRCSFVKKEFVQDARKTLHVSNVVSIEDGYKALTKEPDKVLPKIAALGIKHEVGITNVQVSSPTLEDVFIKLTGKTLRED